MERDCSWRGFFGYMMRFTSESQCLCVELSYPNQKLSCLLAGQPSVSMVTATNFVYVASGPIAKRTTLEAIKELAHVVGKHIRRANSSGLVSIDKFRYINPPVIKCSIQLSLLVSDFRHS
ncbi:hypothetical protein GJ496_008583 [Pomphorhynchus laevis]|nr:hypothetical protein GJ496_008583 [Pomphorhynchus laevis]